MRLVNPVTGLPVDAEGEAVEFLKAHGFKPEAKPRRAPRKQAPKKPKPTE